MTHIQFRARLFSITQCYCVIGMMNDVSNSHSGPSRQRRSKLAPAARAPQSCSIADSPDWWRLRAAIMKALQEFPEARDTVVRALRSLGALKDSDGALS